LRSMNNRSALGNLHDGKVISAFSLRSCQNMSLFYSDTKNSLSNRKNFLQSLGIDYRDLVCAKQVHSGNIRYAQESDLGRGAKSYESSVPDTDAFITDKKNVPLAIFTADCLSIFLFDPKIPAIGLVHAGWRSAKEQIVSRTLDLMQEEFSSRPQDLYAGFGPAIRSCCYEVGREFEDFFPGAVIEKEKKYYLDLVNLSKKQLLDSGVSEDGIFDPQICTSCLNMDFFSFRREGKDCGRIMSVAMLK